MNYFKQAILVIGLICIGFLSAAAKDYSAQLINAAQNGKTATVNRLIKAKANVNAADAEGNTALMLASQQGHKAVVQALLKAGANVNAQNNSGTTALMLAADQGKDEIVALLLKRKAKANLLDANGNSPLFFASAKGYTGIMKQLLAARSRVNRQNAEGQTPLHRVVDTDQKAPIQLLLKYKSYMEFEDNDGYTPVLLAASKGKTVSLDTLRKAGANFNAQDRNGNTPLMLALKNGHSDAADYLLNAQTGTLAPDSQAAADMLVSAAGMDDSEAAAKLTQLLLNRNVPASEQALQTALKANNPAVLSLLLYAQDKDINARDVGEDADTLLTKAVKDRDLNAVKALLAAGADPQARSGLGETPLSTLLLSSSCHAGILQELVNAGADVNAPVFYASAAMTPLDFLQTQKFNQQEATKKKSALGESPLNTAACVQVLQTAGASATLPVKDAKISAQENKLFKAARSGKTSELAQLLASGVSANITDEKGNTPLMEAVRKGQIQTAKQLLQAGADIDMHNSKGETALTVAIKNKKTALFKPLLDAKPTDTWGPLSLAADTANVKLVQTLVHSGLDVDQIKSGMTPLMQAVKEKQNKRAMTLISANADINAVTEGYKNALFFAQEADNQKMIQVLENKGARLTPKGEQQLYALRAQRMANEMTSAYQPEDLSL